MALSNYRSEYLGNGWHEVVVGKPEMFTANSGTEGVTFLLRGDGGTTKATFFLTEAALWRLAVFADACGLTDDELKAYDETNPNSHNVLIGKRVKALVEPGRNPKYHEAVDYIKAGEPTPMPAETPAVPIHDPGPPAAVEEASPF